MRLTILGPPNAGKSSLINALARRDVAIVSETPGTTRDVVEARLDLGGYLLQVADTGGRARNSGRHRGRRRAPRAGPCGRRDDPAAAGRQPGRSACRIAGRVSEPDLLVWNKADLPGFAREGISISLKTGDGLEDLDRNAAAKAAA